MQADNEPSLCEGKNISEMTFLVTLYCMVISLMTQTCHGASADECLNYTVTYDLDLVYDVSNVVDTIPSYGNRCWTFDLQEAQPTEPDMVLQLFVKSRPSGLQTNINGTVNCRNGGSMRVTNGKTGMLPLTICSDTKLGFSNKVYTIGRNLTVSVTSESRPEGIEFDVWATKRDDVPDGYYDQFSHKKDEGGDHVAFIGLGVFVACVLTFIGWSKYTQYKKKKAVQQNTAAAAPSTDTPSTGGVIPPASSRRRRDVRAQPVDPYSPPPYQPRLPSNDITSTPSSEGVPHVPSPLLGGAQTQPVDHDRPTRHQPPSTSTGSTSAKSSGVARGLNNRSKRLARVQSRDTQTPPTTGVSNVHITKKVINLHGLDNGGFTLSVGDSGVVSYVPPRPITGVVSYVPPKPVTRGAEHPECPQYPRALSASSLVSVEGVDISSCSQPTRGMNRSTNRHITIATSIGGHNHPQDLNEHSFCGYGEPRETPPPAYEYLYPLANHPQTDNEFPPETTSECPPHTTSECPPHTTSDC